MVKTPHKIRKSSETHRILFLHVGLKVVRKSPKLGADRHQRGCNLYKLWLAWYWNKATYYLNNMYEGGFLHVLGHLNLTITSFKSINNLQIPRKRVNVTRLLVFVYLKLEQHQQPTMAWLLNNLAFCGLLQCAYCLLLILCSDLFRR